MSDQLFADLRLPRPDLNLEVGSGTHAVQTAEVMRRFEPVARRAPARRASRRRRRQLDARLHAGGGEEGRAGGARRGRAAQLRPRACPKRSTACSPTRSPTVLYTTERSARGQPAARRRRRRARSCFVGNVMIDSLLANRAARACRRRRRCGAHGIDPALLGDPPRLRRRHAAPAVERRRRRRRCAPLLDVLRDVAARLPLVFAAAPAHARQHRALRPRRAARRRRASRCCRRRATSRCWA